MTRRAAAWLLTFALFAGLVIAAATSSGSSDSADATTLKTPLRTFDGTTIKEGGSHAAHVAVVPVEGVIVNGSSSASSGQVGGDDLIDMLEAVRKSGDYDAVILEMNTPGGAVLASDEVSQEVRKVRADGIPVVSWMRDVSASGGYYISASADRIVAHRTTFTGSIGVILEYFDLGGLGKRYGVKQVVIKSGKLKDIGSPYRDITPEERQVLQSVIDEAYAGFVGVVSRGRHLSKNRVRELADGRIYTGQQAFKVGLVDELGARATAYRAAERLAHRHDSSLHGVEVVRFKPRSSLFEALGVAGAQDLHIGALGQLVLAQLRSGGNGIATTTAGGGVAGGGGSVGAVGSLPTIEYRAVIG